MLTLIDQNLITDRIDFLLHYFLCFNLYSILVIVVKFKIIIFQ